MALQKIGKEKEFQYDEDDEELYQNNSPQGFSQLHLPESIHIETIGTGEKPCEQHLDIF